MKLLLGHRDIDPNLFDSGGQTPLSYAVISEDEGVVKLFLEHEGVNPNLSDGKGQTPLSHAASRGYQDRKSTRLNSSHRP